MIYWISMIIFWIGMLFFPTKVIGKKNLIKGKCIWAANHTTNLDVLIIGTKAFTRFFALGKAELFKNKLMGGYLKRLGCVKVKRGQADIQAIKDCLRILKDKQKPLLIFPTGTRNSSAEEVQNLKNGVAMFALKANCPIVPIVLVRKPIFLRPNRLIIGEPIDVSQYQGQKQSKEVYDEINAKLSQSMEDMIAKYGYKKKEKKQKKEDKECL